MLFPPVSPPSSARLDGDRGIGHLVGIVDGEGLHREVVDVPGTMGFTPDGTWEDGSSQGRVHGKTLGPQKMVQNPGLPGKSSFF